MTHGKQIKIEVALRIWHKIYSSIQKGKIDDLCRNYWHERMWDCLVDANKVWRKDLVKRSAKMRLCTLIQYFVSVIWLLYILRLQLRTYPAHILLQLPHDIMFMGGCGQIIFALRMRALFSSLVTGRSFYWLMKTPSTSVCVCEFLLSIPLPSLKKKKR